VEFQLNVTDEYVTCSLHVQSAGHVVPVVHEPAQDAQVHHLEELQVAHPQDIPAPAADRLHRASHLLAARRADRQNGQRLEAGRSLTSAGGQLVMKLRSTNSH